MDGAVLVGNDVADFADWAGGVAFAVHGANFDGCRYCKVEWWRADGMCGWTFGLGVRGVLGDVA